MILPPLLHALGFFLGIGLIAGVIEALYEGRYKALPYGLYKICFGRAFEVLFVLALFSAVAQLLKAGSGFSFVQIAIEGLVIIIFLVSRRGRTLRAVLWSIGILGVLMLMFCLISLFVGICFINLAMALEYTSIAIDPFFLSALLWFVFVLWLYHNFSRAGFNPAIKLGSVLSILLLALFLMILPLFAESLLQSGKIEAWLNAPRPLPRV